MKVTFLICKEGNRWYVHDDNGFTHEENELIAGVPDIIDSLIGKEAKRATVSASTEHFEGAMTLSLVNPDVAGGVEYSMMTAEGKIIGWLCEVFWYYLPTAPEKLYVKIERQDKQQQKSSTAMKAVMQKGGSP